MKTIWLHGLESPAGGERVDYLKSLGRCYAPAMDYRKEGAFKKLLINVENLGWTPDLIIGSSMGGYYGYHLANLYNVNTLLFNPALPYRTVQVDEPLTNTCYTNHHTIVVGDEDDVIIPDDTFSFLSEDKDIKYDFIRIEGMGHRTDWDVFLEYVNRLK